MSLKKFFDKKKPKLFKQSIDKIPTQYLENDIPIFLIDSAKFIMNNIYEGIFRIPGDTKLINEMKKNIEKKQEFLNLIENVSMNIHSVSSIMLTFLRELPEPLIPFNLYNNFLQIAKQYEMDQYTNENSISIFINNLHSLILKLNQRNLKILSFFMNFFYVFSIQSDKHKMNAPTIKFDGRATEFIIIFSIKIDLVCADLSDCLTFSNIKFQTIICTFLIKYYPLIFRNVCETTSLLFPQYQKLSINRKDKILNEITKSMKTKTVQLTIKKEKEKSKVNSSHKRILSDKVQHSIMEEQEKRKTRKSIFIDFRKEVKEKEKEEDKQKKKEFAEFEKTRLVSSTMITPSPRRTEKDEIVAEMRRKRAKSESFATFMMILDKNSGPIELPPLDVEMIKKSNKKKKNKKDDKDKKNKIKQFKFKSLKKKEEND